MNMKTEMMMLLDKLVKDIEDDLHGQECDNDYSMEELEACANFDIDSFKDNATMNEVLQSLNWE